MSPLGYPVVLYDGVCNLCDASVQFILDHDASQTVRFASLQSEVGQELARAHGVDPARLDTLVLIENGRGLVQSDAVLGIAAYLARPWSWAGRLAVVPKPLRNAAYRLVARNRIWLFGRRAACRIPTPDVRARFLDV